MKRVIVSALTVIALFAISPVSSAARVVRVRRAHTSRVRVTVRPGFPIHRALPNVVMRGPVVRVAPRTYLAPVVFGAAVVAALPPPSLQVWRGEETLERADGWTDFTMDVDKRGSRMLLQVDRGAAQISFAEVVFENGETQVVDFNDRVYGKGTYALLDFKDGRKVDHVRIVAQPETAATAITVHLVG